MHPAKRVAVNTGFLYARMAITVFISLYATRLILNALGVKDFGLFNVVGGAIAMLTFLNSAMASATQRFMSYAQGEGNQEKQKHIFNVSIVLHFVIAILVVLMLEGAGYFLFNGILKLPPERIPVAKLLFQFMLTSTFFSIISVPYDAVINAHENMFLVAILGIVEAALKLVIAIYLTQTSFDKLITYGILMASLSIFLLILRRIYCHYKYEEVVINTKVYFSKPLFKEMTSFAGWSFLGSSSSMIANYGQGIVINMFFGTIVNAAQGIANQVSGQLSAFAGTMMKALNPIIDKSEGAGNRNLMITAVMTGSKISFFLLTFFFIPVIIEMPYIFKIWLKKVPDFTIIFCQLLLIRNLIEQLFVTLASSISAHGNIRNFQIISSILCYLPLIISYFLFHAGYPAYFLYITFIIYSILASCIILFFTWNNYRFPVYQFLIHVVLRCIASFLIILIISFLPLLFLKEGLLRLGTVFLVSCIIFPISIWLVGFNKDDRNRFKQLILNNISKYLPKILQKK